MSFNSNIEGLSPALNGLHARIKALESFRKRLAVKGGRNVRITKSGETYVVNAEGEGGGSVTTATTCPLDILTTAVESSGDSPVTTWTVSVRLGTVGGFAPSNWNDLGTIGASDTKYLVAKITADDKSISTVTLELVDEAEGCIRTLETAPPQEFEVLLGALIASEPNDDGVRGAHSKHRAISCGSVGLVPTMVGEGCWTWVQGVV